MTGLKNAQRISYKATYNQVSPTRLAEGNKNNPTKSLLRAVEKVAFVQSLRIIPGELTSIEGRLSNTPNVPTDMAANIPPVLQAIEELINDTSATSTLNNASLFAKIDPGTLVMIATSLSSIGKRSLTR
jgi:hypothetical protein